MSYKILALLFLLTSNAHAASQLGLVASMYFAPTANCNWQRTASTTPAAFNTDSDCPGPTVEFDGLIASPQTTDADLPQVTINSMPGGTYLVQVNAYVGTSTASGTVSLAINDGTTTSGQTEADTTGIGVGANRALFGVFRYSGSGNRTFALFAANGGGGAVPQIDNNGAFRYTRFVITKVK